jgi:antitoxin component YwqK of YwqJK toxin-antitoxin module
MTRKLGCCIILWLLATVAAAQPATQPAIDPALADKRFPFLGSHYTAKGYRIKTTVNDKEFATWDRHSGVDTRTTPLRAGKNTIVVELTPIGENDERIAELTLTASSRSMSTEGEPTIDLLAAELDKGFATITYTIEYTERQPRNFTGVQEAWFDADRKKPFWKYEVGGDYLAEEYAYEKDTTWRPDGKVARTSESKNGKVLTVTAYKPDGSIGHQVKDGNGTDATFGDEGRLEYSCPVKDGDYHGDYTEFHPNGKPYEVITWNKGVIDGPFKRYDEDGKLRVSGQMRDFQPHGQWKRLNDAGETVATGEYKDGELINGKDLFDPEVKE